MRPAAAIEALHPGVTYRSFDLVEAGPERLNEMLREVADGLDSGRLTPLPVRCFSLSEAVSAFRFMAQAKHVGKLVLVPEARPAVRPGTVLVTGGLGALGLATARHLVTDHGVRHLVLAGRRAEEQPAVEELRASGAEVTLAACDVTDRGQLAALLDALPAERPLRGVIHAAMVLDDAVLAEQDAARFSKVMAPKVAGAWNLHQLTKELDLDFFVTFSSVASLLGSAGQSNYSAANAFLDALALHRRDLGLPGQSLCWGPWARLGVAAALDENLRTRLSRQGFDFIEPAEGLALLDKALSCQEALLAVAPMNLRRLERSYAYRTLPPLLRDLVRPRSTPSAASGDTAARLEGLAPEERRRALGELVRSEVARVLALASAAEVPPDRPLLGLGLDSLTTLELRTLLKSELGVGIPVETVLRGITVESLVRSLDEQWVLKHIHHDAKAVTEAEDQEWDVITV